jgi:hypothetical protein
MGAYVFLFFMSLWLAVIATGCVAARARLRREDRTSAGRVALLVAMTCISGAGKLLAAPAAAHRVAGHAGI